MQRTIYVLRRSAEGLHSAINDLHLEEEQDRPFPALVTFVVQRSQARAWGCEITLEVREGFPSAPFGETGTHLSPTIQEMITNARSHSGAKGIAVTLQTRGSDLLAEVLDDGHGLGPETPSGVGLSSMRERGAIVGGKLVIEGQFGQGTRVRLRAPEPWKG